MTDTQNSAVTNQVATDQIFELLTRFLKKHFWGLTSCTIAIVVAVLAVYISNTTSATVKVSDTVKSLELAGLVKKFDQIEHHINDAIKSLEAQIEAALKENKLDLLISAFKSFEATLERKFDQSKQDSRAHISDAIKSLGETLEKKLEQSERDFRAHISDAIKSLGETREKKLEQSERDFRAHISDAIKSLGKTREKKKLEQSERDFRAHISDAIKSLEARIETNLERKLDQLRFFTKNCAELYKSGQNVSGVYTINPDGTGAFDVFCDQTTAGGGWTVFQKRLDGSVDFYRGWTDYKNGFGDHEGEFWLGLDKIHRLTKTRSMLRVDLQDTSGETAHAEYDGFAVMTKSTKYQLSLGTYSGTAGDSLSWHHGFPFTTKDQDNDSWGGNCAVTFKGAWWYRDCLQSNLNGVYHHGKHSSYADGVNWHIWKGYHYSAKRAEMKIRPVEF